MRNERGGNSVVGKDGVFMDWTDAMRFISLIAFGTVGDYLPCGWIVFFLKKIFEGMKMVAVNWCIIRHVAWQQALSSAPSATLFLGPSIINLQPPFPEAG